MRRFYTIENIQDFLMSKNIIWDGTFTNPYESGSPVEEAKVENFENCGYGIRVVLALLDGENPRQGDFVLRVENEYINIKEEKCHDYGYGHSQSFYENVEAFDEDWIKYLLEKGKEGYVSYMHDYLLSALEKNSKIRNNKIALLNEKTKELEKERAVVEKAYIDTKNRLKDVLDMIEECLKSK